LPTRYSRYNTIFSITGDFILLNLLFVVGYFVFDGSANLYNPIYLTFFSYLNFAWFILVYIFGAHKIDRNTELKKIFLTYVKIIVFFFFLFLLYFQATPLSYYPRSYIKFLFLFYFSLLIAWKFLLYFAFYLYRKRGFNYRNVVILGSTTGTRDLQNYFSTNKWHGYRLLGFFDEKTDSENQILGGWKDIKEFLALTHVDEIYIDLNRIPPSIIHEITEILGEYPIKIRILPELGNFTHKSAELINYGSLPVIQVHPGPLSYWYNRAIKRAFDIVLSLFFIVFVLSWLSVLLYIRSIFDSEKGIFFLQKRTGSDDIPFTCIKYRTMQKNAEADLKQAEKKDPRVTSIGRILRKYSLDELPQFINVLLGDMSVVGPRPHMLLHTEQYRKLIKRFMLRHTVKPGITGLAQVNGYRGEIKQLSDINNRVECDVNYVENWSLNLDIQIIFRTLWVILIGQKQAY